MMLKKTYLASAYNGLQQCCYCSSQSCISTTSPQNLPAQRARPLPYTSNKRRRVAEPPTWISTRSYATGRDSGRMEFRDNMNWPCSKAASHDTNPFVPSPYEIFDMQRTGSYGKHTKLKYYELVKIYHPDRNGASCAGLSQPERLERYRLIVLAHEILSDPSKRTAYDAYGAGWGSRQSAATRHSRGFSSTTGQKYGQGAGFDNSPFGNATWEDWERWYRRNSHGHQKQAYAGIYTNPNAFAAFVIVAAILSGILQATRASTMSGNMVEKQLAFTEQTSKFMTQRAATQFDDHQLDSSGRVKAFLEKRDPTRYGLKEDEEGYYKKHFGDTNDEEVTPLGRTRTRTGHGVSQERNR